MADVDKLVKRCQNSTIKMRPVLPLGQPISIGAVGYLEDHAFRYLGTCETMLGLPPGQPLKGQGQPQFELVSGKDVHYSTHAEGQTSEAFGVIANANGAVEISFDSDESFLIAARDVSVSTMENPISLLQRMLDRFSVNAWKEEYCVVYEIGLAETYTSVISQQSGSKLLLSADGSAGKGGLSLGQLAVGSRFEQQKGALDRLIAAHQVPAFFNAYKVRDRFFTGATTETAASLGRHSSTDDIRRILGSTESPFERV
ncbi:hypothetical protein [Streptomyces sp. NBC_01207]|uniref:hypothetical protein n=1 Tax=Streptomyces sp. NBC_01207 TaxID=2903772 RepID=UPI002E148692|nr:hypothetical protein OG457_30395 [Streptomyces sp. NBC_01207]